MELAEGQCFHVPLFADCSGGVYMCQWQDRTHTMSNIKKSELWLVVGGIWLAISARRKTWDLKNKSQA